MSVEMRRSVLIRLTDRTQAKQTAFLAKEMLAAKENPVMIAAGELADLLAYELIEVGGRLLSKEGQGRTENGTFFPVLVLPKGDPLICEKPQKAYAAIIRTKSTEETEWVQKWLLENKKIAYKEISNEICKNRRREMDINSANIEQIVKEVLQGMSGGSSAAAPKAASGAIPKTSRAAMLTALEHYDIKEFPIPEIGDDDILVKVEGCGVCGTDAHEFKRDPFGLIPVVLGHEGTGEVVKIGKNVKKDSAGKPLGVGDKVVTCMIFKDDPNITMFDLNKQNVGDGADVYGLLPDDNTHLNGWFADYIVIRKGSTVFNVSDLSLDMRILIEPCAVLIHAVERAKTTGILRFNSRVVVQGCGPIGLICIAILRTMGIENIVAVDGEEKRLSFAKEMGATASVNFKNHSGVDALADAVKDAFGGYYADFAFQCTGSPVAHANIYKFIRKGGGLCELGFFINGGDATINPHFDICAKEITTVGSWVYTLRDYATTFDFLKRAKGIGIPLEKLITHKFPLSQINEAHITNLKMEGLKIAIINE